MNSDFDIKITCREGSVRDDDTYPEELSCCGYALFAFDGKGTRVLVHGTLPTKAIGLHTAKGFPEFAKDLMLGLAQGVYDDEDNQ